MGNKERNGSVAKIAASVGGVLIAAFIAFFVWLAHLSSRVTVILVASSASAGLTSAPYIETVVADNTPATLTIAPA